MGAVACSPKMLTWSCTKVLAKTINESNLVLAAEGLFLCLDWHVDKLLFNIAQDCSVVLCTSKAPPKVDYILNSGIATSNKGIAT